MLKSSDENLLAKLLNNLKEKRSLKWKSVLAKHAFVASKCFAYNFSPTRQSTKTSCLSSTKPHNFIKSNALS